MGRGWEGALLMGMFPLWKVVFSLGTYFPYRRQCFSYADVFPMEVGASLTEVGIFPMKGGVFPMEGGVSPMEMFLL